MNKDKNYLVSVIVNCYNGEKFVNRCIKSILKQTYCNFEIIFWDNLSTDNTFLELKKFNDKRIRYFKSKKHKKLYEARNSAIRKVKGDFISFLDIDDTWVEDKLKLQVKEIIKRRADICFSNHWISHKKVKIFKKSLSSKNIFLQILNDYPISILTVLLKKKIFKKMKFYFNPKFEIIGDFDFFFRLSRIVKFCVLNKPLATYYIHKNNLSIKKLNLEVKEFNYWIKKNSDILKKNKNSIFQKNHIRKCVYLLSKNKLSIFSKNFMKIDSVKYKIIFLLKIFYKNLK